MPTPTLVQQTSEARSSSAGSLSWSFTSTPTGGNYIIIAVATVTTSAASLGTPTDNQGTSYALAARSTAVGGGSDFRVSLYYGKVQSTATGTFTLTATGGTATGRWAGAAAEFSNMRASTSAVLSTTVIGTAAASATLSLSITSATTAGLILGAAGGNITTTGATWTQQGAPWVNLFDEPDGSAYHHSLSEYRTITSSGTYASTWAHIASSAIGNLTGALALFEGSTFTAIRPNRMALLGVV